MKRPRGWRKAQMIYNFTEWLKTVKEVEDYFYMEDEVWDRYYEEFLSGEPINSLK